MPSCPRCQTALPDPPERFCPSCGADLTQLPTSVPTGAPPPPPPPPSDATPQTPWLPPVPAAGAGYGSYGAPHDSAWSEGPGARTETPWERRHEIGLATALVETTQRVLTRPTEFFRSMPVTGGIGAPLVYALIIGYAGIVVSAIYNFVLESVMGSAFTRMSSGGSDAMAGMMPYLQGGLGLGLQVIFGPVMVAVSLFLVAGITHLALLALGGASRGFEATFRVACYSEAAALLNIIPACGNFVSAIVMLVLMIIGIAEAHGISRGRAAAAVLLPIVLCCCCILIPLGFGLASLIGAASMQ
jgi:hypothetical protein